MVLTDTFLRQAKPKPYTKTVKGWLSQYIQIIASTDTFASASIKTGTDFVWYLS